MLESDEPLAAASARADLGAEAARAVLDRPGKHMQVHGCSHSSTSEDQLRRSSCGSEVVDASLQEVAALQAPQEPLAGVLIDLLDLDIAQANNSGLSPAEAVWAAGRSAKELGSVLGEFGILHDPLLCKRLAQLLAQRPAVWGTGYGDDELRPLLDQLSAEWCCERPNLSPDWLRRAVRMGFGDAQALFLRVLEVTVEALALGGLLGVLISQQWEAAALRSFVCDYEALPFFLSRLIACDECATLYPRRGASSGFVLRASEAGTRRAEATIGSRTPHATLYLFEKVPVDQDPISMCTEPSPKRLHLDPGACLDPDPNLADGAGAMRNTDVLPGDGAEFAAVTAQLAARKDVLRLNGQSGKQAKSDPEVRSLIAHANAIRRAEPSIAAAAAARVRARSEARSHVSVLLSESVDALLGCSSFDEIPADADRGGDSGRGGIYDNSGHSSACRDSITCGLLVDCTFGRGGHTRALLSRLGSDGRVLAFDVDGEAVAVGRRLEAADPRFFITHRPFADFRAGLAELPPAWIEKLPLLGILLDLGVSSPQLDEAHRGFSCRAGKDGPLDLRMNQSPAAGPSCASWLAAATPAELGAALTAGAHSLEPRAIARIAAAVIARQRIQPFTTTRGFASFLDECSAAGLGRCGGGEAIAVRLPPVVFTALRVHLNDEVAQLERVLEVAFDALAEGGRMVVLTFIKWEVVVLRRFLRNYEEPPTGLYSGLLDHWRLAELYPLLASTKAYACCRIGPPRRPSPDELRENPRSKTALIHTIEKVPRRIGGNACSESSPQ